MFVFAAYNMNSTFLIDWIGSMGGMKDTFGLMKLMGTSIVVGFAGVIVMIIMWQIRKER